MLSPSMICIGTTVGPCNVAEERQECANGKYVWELCAVRRHFVAISARHVSKQWRLRFCRHVGDSKIRVAFRKFSPRQPGSSRGNNFKGNSVVSFVTLARLPNAESGSIIASRRRLRRKAVDIVQHSRSGHGMAGLRQLIGGSLAASVPRPTGHLTVIYCDGRGPRVR
jgi:hypothetical protein